MFMNQGGHDLITRKRVPASSMQIAGTKPEN